MKCKLPHSVTIFLGVFLPAIGLGWEGGHGDLGPPGSATESTIPDHIAKSAIVEYNSLTVGEQKNAIQNFYNLLLTEFHHMWLQMEY